VAIRARLTIGVALLLLAGFGLLGVTVVTTTRAALIEQVDARIRAATVHMEPSGPARHDVDLDGDRDRGHGGSPDGHDAGDHGPASQSQALPNNVVFSSTATPSLDAGTGTTAPDVFQRPIARLIYAPDGRLIAAEPSGYPDAPDPLPVLSITDPAVARMEGRIVTLSVQNSDLAYRALIERNPDGMVVVTAAPLSDVEEAIARVMRAVAIAALTTLAVTAFASWWLIRIGLRPVDRMVDIAAAIAGGDLSRRIPDANPRTELGRLGAALNDMLSQIEQSTAARAASEARLRRFVADAAHELRTPLTSLRGYVELYSEGALATPEALNRAMGRIGAEASRMGRLVEDLLLLARLDQQRALELERVDLVVLAHEAATDFTAIAPQRPFTTDLEDDAVVLGDRVRLRQVIDNLLTNARTHTPAETPVRLTVRGTGQIAELIVADEGPGIPEVAQERVFERFWRGDPGRSRARGGTGLGLSIVASIVAAHGGTVDLSSAPGQGTTFTVRLPLAQMARPVTHVVVATADEDVLRGVKVS
jgi:two-component system OmpR family sensor kinase